LNGDIIYMNDGEIWYRDKDVATLVLFKNEKPDFLTINLDKVKAFRKMSCSNILKIAKSFILKRNLAICCWKKEKLPLRTLSECVRAMHYTKTMKDIHHIAF